MRVLSEIRVLLEGEPYKKFHGRSFDQLYQAFHSSIHKDALLLWKIKVSVTPSSSSYAGSVTGRYPKLWLESLIYSQTSKSLEISRCDWTIKGVKAKSTHQLSKTYYNPKVGGCLVGV